MYIYSSRFSFCKTKARLHENVRGSAEVFAVGRLRWRGALNEGLEFGERDAPVVVRVQLVADLLELVARQLDAHLQRRAPELEPRQYPIAIQVLSRSD